MLRGAKGARSGLLIGTPRLAHLFDPLMDF
jgi:hypothetical protein